MPTTRLRIGASATRRVAPVLCALAVLWSSPFASPLGADVLVMKDGARVETEGSWEVRGRQVRFTQKNGALSAVRLSEVDLEASRAATEAAKAPAPDPQAEAEEVRREPVLVITNDDIGVGPDDVVEGGAGDGATGESASGTSPVTGELVVADWTYTQSGGDAIYELSGRIENRSDQVAENIQLYVDMVAVDAEGQAKPNVHLLRQANLESTRLEPRESTDFRYLVTARDLQLTGTPDDFESPRVSFDVQARKVAADTADDGVEITDAERGDVIDDDEVTAPEDEDGGDGEGG